MTPQLISKSFSKLLEKYPHLRTLIDQGRFLTGYTQGSYSGNQVNVFLVRSPWTQFCLQATAMGVLPPGAVLLITEEAEVSPQGSWKAYTLESLQKAVSSKTINPSLKESRERVPDPSASQVQTNNGSSLTSTAASIAIETERNYASSRLKDLCQQQLVK